MTEVVSNQWVRVVRDPMAVDVLLNLTATRRLAPFMREQHTLGSAAAELNVPASSLAYWVQRFVRTGLVEVVEQRARAGKAIPVYRATADEFRIPLDAMPPGAREEFMHGGRRLMFARFTAAVEKAARRHFAGGLRIRSAADRGVDIGFVEPDDHRPSPVTEWWGTVSLTDDEALALRRELEALVSRHDRPVDDPGRRQYVMMIGLAPDRRRR